MSRRLVVVAGGLAAAVAVWWAPVALAGSTTVSPSAEAWYQPSPAPAGALPPASPYPKGTLHVGVAAGRENARAYLALPRTAVAGTVTGGTLLVPLDTAQADGDSASSTADVQACLASGVIEPVEGSFDPPPRTDCSSSAPVRYVATPEPHLEADLGPLLHGLRSATGIALLPDATKVQPTDSWRVVFSSHDRADAAKTAPATLRFTVDSTASGTRSADAFAPPGDSTDAPVFADVGPPVGTDFAAPATPSIAPTPPPEAAVAPPGAAAPRSSNALAAPTPEPTRSARGYPYPVAWLLPLVLLVLVPSVVSALTADLGAP